MAAINDQARASLLWTRMVVERRPKHRVKNSGSLKLPIKNFGLAPIAGSGALNSVPLTLALPLLAFETILCYLTHKPLYHGPRRINQPSKQFNLEGQFKASYTPRKP